MRFFAYLFILVVLSACTTTQAPSSVEISPPAPTLSVERFLEASNERDLHSMARLFGDEDGPAIETGNALGCAFKRMGSWVGLGSRCPTLEQVELEMDLIAELLTHDAYRIGAKARAPGRGMSTTRVEVDLIIRGREYQKVPFYVVQPDDGRWLVQEIDLQRVTGAKSGSGVR